MAQRRRHSFLLGAFILMVGAVVVKIAGALFKIPLGNLISEEGIGYFDNAYLLFIPIYTLAIAGLPVAVSRVVAQNVASHRYNDVKRIYKVASKAFAVTGTIGFILILALAYPYSRYMVKNTGMLFSSIVMAPAILLSCMMAVHRGYYEGLKNMFPTAFSQALEAVGKLVVGLYFAHWVISYGMDQFEKTGIVYGVAAENSEMALRACLPLAAAGAMCGVTLGALFGLIFLSLYKKIKGDGITIVDLKASPPARSDKAILKALVKISIPVAIGSLVLNISNFIDSFTIQGRLHAIIDSSPQYLYNLYKEVLPSGMEVRDIPNWLFGCYHGYAVTLYNLIPSLTAVFGISAIPTVTTAWTLQNKAAIKRNVESILRIVMIVAAPCGMGFVMMSGPILRLLYTGKGVLHVGPPLLSMLGVAVIFVSVATTMNAILQATGRADLPAKIILGGCIIKILCNYILVAVPWINIYGAPVGTIFCYLFIVVVSSRCLRKNTKVSTNIVTVAVKPLVAAFLCGVSARVIYNLLGYAISEKSSVVIAILGAALIYLVLLFALRVITKNDIMMIPKSSKIAKTLEKMRWLG